MATLEEQETIITQNRLDDFVSVYTSNPFDIRYFKSREEFTLVEEWLDADTGEVEAAAFSLPKERANIRKIVKSTRNLTDEQRQELADRLSKARNAS